MAKTNPIRAVSSGNAAKTLLQQPHLWMILPNAEAPDTGETQTIPTSQSEEEDSQVNAPSWHKHLQLNPSNAPTQIAVSESAKQIAAESGCQCSGRV